MKNPKRAYKFISDLPPTISQLKNADETTNQQLAQDKAELKSEIATLKKEIEYRLDNIAQKHADVLHQLSGLSAPVASPSKPSSSSALQADNHSLDGYYRAFEEKFRGSEEVIYDRLKKSYGKLLSGLASEIKDSEVLDIGCGRGELLKLYKELGVKSLGLDLNKSMVERCKKLGYNAKQVDAIAYIKDLKSSSVAGISGIHFVEHIPFELLYDLMNESFRVLKPGGFILFETPNPENLTVGAFSFWYDSSHLKPLPPDVLKFMGEYVGFNEVEIIKLHPVKATPDAKSSPLNQVLAKINGPRDYALFARKFS